jgi:glycosyltransferase involved in cell wall biosynthesis
MNILYYLKTFPRLSQSFILNELHTLEQAGHTVAVFAQGSGGDLSAHPEFEELEAPINYGGKLTHTELVSLLVNDTLDRSMVVRRLASNPSVQEVATLARTKQCVNFVTELDWDIDSIHTHFATQDKMAVPNVASYFDVPFTLTTHAYDIFKEANLCTDQLLSAATRIVTISEYNRNYMQQEFGTDTPIDIVRAGIKPEKFTPTSSTEPNRVLTVARHQKKKGLHNALEGVAIATQELPNLEYHLIGSGPLSESLADHARNLGIEEHVSFLDTVTDDRLIREYDRARCFLLPCVVTESGERDGIPVALMEAMAMESPPISTPISGIPELIDHEQSGLLVKPRNPESIAQAIVRLMESDSMWNELRQHGRTKVREEFNITTEVAKLEHTFEAAQRDTTSITEKRRHPPLRG